MEVDPSQVNPSINEDGDTIELIGNPQPKRTTKMESTDSDSTRAETSPLHKLRERSAHNKKADDLQAHSLRVIIISAIVFAVAVTIALILTIYLGPPQIGAHGAVATDVPLCSDIGLDILMKGGNAVDSAVAALFCLGVVHPHSSGLGGGGFMIVHDHKTEKTTSYDYREVSPKAATSDMFTEPENRLFGGLSVAVPGELKGLAMVHKEYGKLSWSEVVLPAADVARTGFNVTRDLAYVLETRFTVEQFRKYGKIADIFVRDGRFVREGDYLILEDLAGTLDSIAEQGAEVLYSGHIADTIINTLNGADVKGVMTSEDLKEYSVKKRNVIKSKFKDNTIVTMAPPSAGSLLLLMMNVFTGYNWTESSLKDPMTYHNMIETFRFSYAHMGLLGDPDFSDSITNASNLMIAGSYGDDIRKKIDNETHPSDFYQPLFLPVEDKGTTHLSVIDTSELMVSATSTINWWFGSLLMTPSGIILNDEMADFSFPGAESPFGLPPNQNNFLEPGKAKRPLSSMAPSIVYNEETPCSMRMAVGASNGSKILTGIAETILNVMVFGMEKDLKGAIEKPRIHNQLFPPETVYESKFPKDIRTQLEKMGHTFNETLEGINVVQAVMKINDDIYAHSDSRKNGKAALFRKK